MKGPYRKWTLPEQNRLRVLVPFMSNADLAIAMGRSISSISSEKELLHIPGRGGKHKPPEERKRVRYSREQAIVVERKLHLMDRIEHLRRFEVCQ
jgi:hypothetical protein